MRRNRMHTRSFELGETVTASDYRGNRKWLSGKIVEQTGPVSYKVELAPEFLCRPNQNAQITACQMQVATSCPKRMCH